LSSASLARYTGPACNDVANGATRVASGICSQTTSDLSVFRSFARIALEFSALRILRIVSDE
jgi:hypothetical protein